MTIQEQYDELGKRWREYCAYRFAEENELRNRANARAREREAMQRRVAWNNRFRL